MCSYRDSFVRTSHVSTSKHGKIRKKQKERDLQLIKLPENHGYTYNIMSVHKAKPKLTHTEIKRSKNIFMNISETKSSDDYTYL